MRTRNVIVTVIAAGTAISGCSAPEASTLKPVPRVKTQVVTLLEGLDARRVAHARSGCHCAARTGEVGDGTILVLPMEKVYRILTGEEDQDAVTPVMIPM